MFGYLCIYLKRERGRALAGEGGRERIPSRLHTVSAESDVGLDPMNCEIVTAETKR